MSGKLSFKAYSNCSAFTDVAQTCRVATFTLSWMLAGHVERRLCCIVVNLTVVLCAVVGVCKPQGDSDSAAATLTARP